MFNALTPPELIRALGQVLRAAADSEGPSDQYGRSQLLSAYSIARHLAAEEAARADLLDWFRQELDSVLQTDDRPIAARARDRIAAAQDGREVGDVLGELIDGLGNDDQDRRLRRRLHGAFADMADREVAGLERAYD